MHIRTINFCLVLSLLVTALTRAYGVGVPTIVLKSTRAAVLNDGRDYHEIIADIRDNTGAYVPDNTTVTFQASGGQFSGPTAVGTRAGSARIRLTSLQKGTATVTASVNGGGFQQLPVIFTDDPAETYQGNSFIEAQASGALLYGPGDRVIEASGHAHQDGDQGLPGASMSYRSIQVFADKLQIDCSANAVRASGNVHLVKAGKRLNCSRLYFPLLAGDGFAIVEQGKRLAAVKVKASDLSVEIPKNGVAPKIFEMADISQAPQVISARQVRLFPGEKLQFKRPKFYQDGQLMFSIPFYSLALYSNQLFTDQFVSVGSQGLGMDLPLYYDLSPSSTGIFHIRHGEQSGRSVFATRPGWSLDVTQAYSSNGNRRYTGEMGFTGIARDDWGVRWSHSQEFAGDTRASVFFDLPQHRSLFGSTNLSKQMGPIRVGLNLSGNRSLSGFSTSGNEGDLFLETTPKKLGKSGYMMALGANASSVNTQTGTLKQRYMSQGVQARFFSNPFKLDKFTSLTNYMTVGNIWADQGRGGSSVVSSLTATRTLGAGASLQMTYDYAHQPDFITGGGNHRLSTSLLMNGGSKWNLYLFSTMALDAKNTSIISDLNYAIAPRWRFNLSTTIQEFATAHYKDFSFGIARTISGRDFLLSYSTLNRRLFFDFQASRF